MQGLGFDIYEGGKGKGRDGKMEGGKCGSDARKSVARERGWLGTVGDGLRDVEEVPMANVRKWNAMERG